MSDHSQQNFPPDGADRLILTAVDCWAYLRHWRLVKRFREKMGHWPAVALPRSYNEKVLWRKIFDHNPLFVTLCDKLQAKEIFRRHCPGLAIVEPRWIGERAEDIPDEALKGNCVVKSNCGSAHNVFIHDGRYDRRRLMRTVRRWLRGDFGARKGEWAYGQVSPRVYVEPMLQVRHDRELININVETFGGEADNVFVVSDKQAEVRRAAVFDPSGNRLAATVREHLTPEQQYPPDFEVPECFHDAVRFARVLGPMIDYARIDFMSVDGRLYGCEFTPYSLSGFVVYTDPEIALSMTAKWDIGKSWFLSAPQRGWRKRYAKALSNMLASAGDRPH